MPLLINKDKLKKIQSHFVFFVFSQRTETMSGMFEEQLLRSDQLI